MQLYLCSPCMPYVMHLNTLWEIKSCNFKPSSAGIIYISDLIRIQQLLLYVLHVAVCLPFLPFPILHAGHYKDSVETNCIVTSMAGGQIMVQRVRCCVS